MVIAFATECAQDDDLRPLLEIARGAIIAEVRHENVGIVAGTAPVRPVFVTIERKGKVIGCRGSLQTRASSLEAEVALAARSAAQHDPRYAPLTRKDLDGFSVTVTVVDRLEGIESVEGLLPEHGLVLTSGERTGVVLPWEGKDPATRLKWAFQKAKVNPGSPARLERMLARRLRG